MPHYWRKRCHSAPEAETARGIGADNTQASGWQINIIFPAI